MILSATISTIFIYFHNNKQQRNRFVKYIVELLTRADTSAVGSAAVGFAMARSESGVRLSFSAVAALRMRGSLLDCSELSQCLLTAPWFLLWHVSSSNYCTNIFMFFYTLIAYFMLPLTFIFSSSFISIERGFPLRILSKRRLPWQIFWSRLSNFSLWNPESALACSADMETCLSSTGGSFFCAKVL